MISLLYVGFRSPVNMHSHGDVMAWESKRMAKITPAILAEGVRFVLENGKTVLVRWGNISYELYDVEPVRTQASQAPGNAVPKAKA